MNLLIMDEEEDQKEQEKKRETKSKVLLSGMQYPGDRKTVFGNPEDHAYWRSSDMRSKVADKVRSSAYASRGPRRALVTIATPSFHQKMKQIRAPTANDMVNLQSLL
jgi:hypothetical protein